MPLSYSFWINSQYLTFGSVRSPGYPNIAYGGIGPMKRKFVFFQRITHYASIIFKLVLLDSLNLGVGVYSFCNPPSSCNGGSQHNT